MIISYDVTDGDYGFYFRGKLKALTKPSYGSLAIFLLTKFVFIHFKMSKVLFFFLFEVLVVNLEYIAATETIFTSGNILFLSKLSG